MDLGAKLQVKEGKAVSVINAPRGLKLGIKVTKGPSDAVLFFAKDSATLMGGGESAVQAAKADKLCWIAYPKAGQLGTDLNRDKLWALLKRAGIEPVRQVSLDEVWSALRFRPSK